MNVSHRTNIQKSSGSGRTRTLVVDPHLSVAEMVSQCLDREGCLVIGKAHFGSETISIFRQLQPELVIIELETPDLGGAQIVAKFREEKADVKILIYSASTKPQLIHAALRLGAQGFVHKSESLATFHLGYRIICQGGKFFSPWATQLLSAKPAEDESIQILTSKEQSVLQLVVEGLSSKQVAGRLFLSPKTIDHYRKSIMRKLNITDVPSLTRYAIRIGLSNTLAMMTSFTLFEI